MTNNEEIGKRIRLIRRMIGITRQNLSAKYNIEYATIALWETGKTTITDKVIHQCVQFFLTEGVHCSFEWIKFQKGEEPKIVSKGISIVDHLKKQDVFKQEIQFFLDIEAYKEHNKNSILHQIKNNAMSPLLNVGDIAGGPVIKKSEDIIKAHARMCILSIEENKFMVRHFFIRKNKYILTAENTGSEVINPIVLKEKPLVIAPINFYRKSPIDDF
jgi:transcriptional regulator with XRE-family HTH domain